MRVIFNICCHPDRAHLVPALLEQLPEKDTYVFVDDPPSGTSWTNYRQVLMAAGGDGEDWVVSLDDDAILCNGFVRQVRAALKVCPGDFASFYLYHRESTERAREAGVRWLETVRVVHGIAWAIRGHLGQEVVEVAEELVKDDHRSGDRRLKTWLIATQRKAFVTMPNLVNHRNDVRSVMRPRAVVGTSTTSAWYRHDPGKVKWDSSSVVDDEGGPRAQLERLAVQDALKDVHNRVWKRIEAGEYLR